MSSERCPHCGADFEPKCPVCGEPTNSIRFSSIIKAVDGTARGGPPPSRLSRPIVERKQGGLGYGVTIPIILTAIIMYFTIFGYFAMDAEGELIAVIGAGILTIWVAYFYLEGRWEEHRDANRRVINARRIRQDWGRTPIVAMNCAVLYAGFVGWIYLNGPFLIFAVAAASQLLIWAAILYREDYGELPVGPKGGRK